MLFPDRNGARKSLLKFTRTITDRWATRLARRADPSSERDIVTFSDPGL